MLRVKAAQMRSLGAAARRRFEDASVAMLRAEFAQTTAAHPDDVLHKFVRLGIDRARAYGVVAVSDVERWLRLMVRFGPKFDENPRVREILSEGGDAQQRMDAIEALSVNGSEAQRARGA